MPGDEVRALRENGATMETRVYLSLGSNLGDRAANLFRALNLLAPAACVERVSSLYETAPVGVTDQPAFLNTVAEVTTGLAPAELLKTVKAIERDVGRRPGMRWGPRVVDIDIILYGDVIVDGEVLTIPHPRMTERAFVLIPLAELAADVREPKSGQTVDELARAVRGKDGVQRIGRLTWCGEANRNGVSA
ncbi:MAG TPA: 2-amino-4-hydroxy-6-hydroxymethyldihydropteridine diphosphokinase [Chloroflexota bacterium]|nr:2-amino-4-hydroxy-6-hydroxymethyldihydropteridine diphosphokinase [Chloroflexota bacterium]